MICKKDVILWFKELESYKRIDTMCTLLNMCLPFELRFLGTCLEELGRRDSQELRGMELRVNNPQDLATDMVACQKGEPTDKKIRRKMALYLALIRACNRTCVTEIFRTLDGWGDRDFYNMTDLDTLQELLLVYIMAANHPVFSFDQHLKCTEIFEKIKENKLVCEQSTSLHIEQQQQHQSMAPPGHQQDIRQHLPPPPPSHQELLQQHALHAMHLSAAAAAAAGQHPHPQLTAAPIQVLPQGTIPMNFPQAHLAKLIPADGGNIQHQITVDGIPHMISSNITIPADSSNTIMAHPNATWTLRPYGHPPGPQSVEHPPQSSSPMLSQQSSPSSSRTTSPNRASNNTNLMQQQGGSMQTQQTQQQQVRNLQQRITGSTLKNVRRPSSETTPPPMTQQQQQQQQQHQQMMSNEMIIPQNMKHMDDVIMNSDGTGNQLQALIRNGFTRAGHHARLKAANYIPPHQQQQQQQSPVNQHFQATMPANNFPISYSMQNMSLTDGVGGGGGGPHSIDGNMMSMNSNSKSTGSDSGSSIGSSGEISPPETPTLLTNATSNPGGLRMSNDQKHHPQPISYKQQQLSLSRLNGRSDKMLSVSGQPGSSSVSTIIYAPNSGHPTGLTQQQSQQLFGTDIILAPGGNAGAGSTNLMQSSLANNNNGGGGSSVVVNTSANNTSSNNNNMGSNTVLISSPSGATPGGGGLIGNVITSNSVLLQSHQPQYNNTYPYHAAAAAAAAQHLASTSRPPLMTHNPGMAPPPPGTFRLPPGFQLPPNGEILYPAYHPAGITFLSGGAPPGAPPVTLRSTNSASVTSNAGGPGVPPPPQLQQQQQPPQQQMQSAQTVTLPNAALLSASPYSTLTVGINKPVSCYNCGSQTHIGRDCQEASMDDVTRNAIYKLDYSVSASSSTTSPTNSTGGGGNSTGGGGGGGGGGDIINISGGTSTSSSSASSTSSHSSLPPSAAQGGAINTK